MVRALTVQPPSSGRVTGKSGMRIENRIRLTFTAGRWLCMDKGPSFGAVLADRSA